MMSGLDCHCEVQKILIAPDICPVFYFGFPIINSVAAISEVCWEIELDFAGLWLAPFEFVVERDVFL
jgi:hypothetical protein